MLTPRNIQVLNHLHGYARKHRAWPSCFEIAHRLKLDRVTVHYHLKLLKGCSLVMVRKTGWCSYWYLTSEGYKFLGVPPVTIAFSGPSRRLRNRPGKLGAYTRKENAIRRATAWEQYGRGSYNQYPTIDV